jgi:hypothetical protein
MPKEPRLQACLAVFLALLLVVLVPTDGARADESAAARADDPDFLNLAVGAFDVRDDQTTAEARLEFRSRQKFLFLKPFGGLMLTAEGGGHLYGGLLLDLFWGRRWVTTVTLAPGFYFEGAGKDLGHALEVRSGIELAYRLDDGARFGLALSHLSNSVVTSAPKNPGAESVMLFYAVALERILGP